jgi:thiol-disulfide isomerase/thioredoxin
MVKARFPQAATVVTAAVAVFALILSLSAAGGAADDPQTPDETPAETAEEEKPDPFAVPAEATPEELSLFLRRIGRMQPEERTQEGLLAHIGKLNTAVDEVLTRELDDETAQMAAGFKLEVLTLLGNFGDETAEKQIAEFIEKLSKDERPALVELARNYKLSQRIRRVAEMEPAERQELIDEIAGYLADGEITERDAGIASATAGALEDANPEAAIAAYSLFAKHLESADNPDIAAAAKEMHATVRRLGLPGNPIEVSGQTLTGEQFNITQYKDKVVLVDFWATWCGPCIGELPNVLDNYAKYHGKGFEVVGISLDDDPEALQTFVTENEIPWVTLFPPEEDKRGWENPVARYYGITGIPTVILVNQEGNVVSLNARGEELGRLLQELLGDPLEVPEEKPETPAGDTPEASEKETADKP